MTPLTKITLDPARDGRQAVHPPPALTVGTVAGLVRAGRTVPEILAAYPYLEEADIREALSYSAGPPAVSSVS